MFFCRHSNLNIICNFVGRVYNKLDAIHCGIIDLPESLLFLGIIFQWGDIVSSVANLGSLAHENHIHISATTLPINSIRFLRFFFRVQSLNLYRNLSTRHAFKWFNMFQSKNRNYSMSQASRVVSRKKNKNQIYALCFLRFFCLLYIFFPVLHQSSIRWQFHKQRQC